MNSLMTMRMVQTMAQPNTHFHPFPMTTGISRERSASDSGRHPIDETRADPALLA
jgi:hypothetical protein